MQCDFVACATQLVQLGHAKIVYNCHNLTLPVAMSQGFTYFSSCVRLSVQGSVS